MVIASTLSCAGIVGAATTYFVHRPGLNKAGVQLLGRGALQGVTGAVAAAVLTLFTFLGLLWITTKKFSSSIRNATKATVFTIYSALFAVFSKYALNRVGIQISYQEALTTTLTANAVALGVFASLF